MKSPLLLAALFSGWLAAAHASDTDCRRLVDWMTGSFSSARQAAADSSYYDIALRMARIWTDREDGYWFYVEQAVAETADKPYRQRVYRVSQVESDLFKSEVFLIPDPEKYVGEWRKENPLRDVSPDDLELRGGCTVFLRLDARGAFTGGTVGRACASDRRGAAYATSEVVIGPGRIESWDRGFDESGRQVWGAVRGPYVFIRRADGPSR
ncbi:MAG: chromophore lyase CpcT/CpeT [Bacteroidota bacterium]